MIDNQYPIVYRPLHPSRNPEGGRNHIMLIYPTEPDSHDINEFSGANPTASHTQYGGSSTKSNQLMSIIEQLMKVINTLMGRLKEKESGTGSPSIGDFSTEPQTKAYTPAQAKATGEKLTTNLMKDLGLTREQAAGIVGNIQAESDLNPGINQGGKFGPPGSGGAGFGWVQWSGPRRDHYVQFAKEKGLDPRSEAANYAFLLHELRGPYKSVLDQVRNARSASQSAEIIFHQYEMPYDDSLGRRIKFARQWA